MRIIPYIEGRIIVTERQADEDLLIKFGTLLAAYDINKATRAQRTKLKRLWVQMEYAAKERVEMSMGVKRSDIFECNEGD